MNKHEKINYVEFPAKDLEKTKEFFSKVFGWTFVDYGPEYIAFSNEGLDGGFFKSNLSDSSEKCSFELPSFIFQGVDTLARVL